ncbi:ATP-dependent metallopeptidase FtsH/Yme1/Tma family protein [Brevibacillus sp. NPDC058079]|uniref:ATP-dependent metallopeptidase FtsH/Yme1/Tma family protein n=1 Tax=Brevibacillus sp. NPDC058079 TaxID=3346330 RepID=UPI0036E76FD9
MKEFWKKTKEWAKNNQKTLAFLIMLTIMFLPFFFQLAQGPESEKIEYTGFTKMIGEAKVKSVKIDLSSPTFTFMDKEGKEYKTDNPKRSNFKDELLTKGIDVNEIDPRDARATQDTMRSILNIVMWTVVFFVAMHFIQKRMGHSNAQQFEVTEEDKSKSKSKSSSKAKTTFSQIAGNEEAKEDMQFLVDFLKNPKKYASMGAKLPKGVIFYGSPGTGKTLFARAIAGEAGVPFFSVSGSDFVEMYAGLGAKRVRDLFATARKKAPSIIFIDEIDAIGGSRDRESHSEQRQTLNAILKEMDGFDSNQGIIVIGATNRLSDLDSAFIRPGRFDKHIAIDLPDQKSRFDILKLHSRNKPLSEDVNLEELSKMTVGLSGAFLESIMNEAAILATTRNQSKISKYDIDDAYYKVVMKGHKKKGGDTREDDEIRLVAWHEAGHALVAKLLTDLEVPKVTIVPSTSGAGGVAFIIPKKMGLYSKEELLNDIKISYAGRAAEYLLLGSEMKVTTGASSDIENATNKIKLMISQVGMSDRFGMLNLKQIKSDDNAILEEATEMSKKLYTETVELLEKHKHCLQAIAEELILKESLNEEELMTIINQHMNVEEKKAS